jgi:hypothetical protein
MSSDFAHDIEKLHSDPLPYHLAQSLAVLLQKPMVQFSLWGSEVWSISLRSKIDTQKQHLESLW